MNVIAQESHDRFSLFNGDCVELMQSLPENSIDMSIFSPPYLSLYVYSNSERDMGNARTDAEFYEHFRFVIVELMRTVKPGRIVCVDCMNVPAMKGRDGYIGLKDFRGELIREFTAQGFIFHSEFCMWKDPLIEATRTKSIGLMHKQLCKDSAMSRAGLPQYLLAFRKPGENTSPIAHKDGLDSFIGDDPPHGGNLSHERWRRYASPVWMDINFSRTLNVTAARDSEDERHIAPMALDAIERALTLYSNPDDVIFTPFLGIGSEIYSALTMGRRGIGFELKPSYFKVAVENCRSAVVSEQTDMFAPAE